MRALLCLILGVCASVWGGASPALTNPPSSLRLNLGDGAQAQRRLPRPVNEFDCNDFLELRGKSLEADLEGAARIGNRAFWIGSHGRNIIGKERLNRHRFFATDIRIGDGDVTLTPVGRPCKTLLEDLLRDSRFAQFHLEEASLHTPKEPNALNIEGLAATPEGYLLIGFRNPIPAGKALLIPLLNPNEVVEGTPARFGPVIQLDLGRLGIRDIAWHEGTYVIIAGSYHGGSHFRLYRWAGPGARPERLRVDHLNDFHPEALVIYRERGLREFQILSDDGTLPIDGCPCKELKDHNRQAFRSFWVTE